MMFTDDEVRDCISRIPHWYHQIELRPGIRTPGTNNSPEVLRILDLPKDCSGLRVLDLGTRDGFFAFEIERRGGQVVALDYFASDQTGFAMAAAILGSKMQYVQDNIYNITPQKYGEFDIVLFLGLIYHLRDPLLALDLVRDVCRHEMYLETQLLDDAFLLPDGQMVSLASIAPVLSRTPIMQFYPGSSLKRDFTNYWSANVACMQSMLAESCFEIVHQTLYGERGVFKCRVVEDPEMRSYREYARGTIG